MFPGEHVRSVDLERSNRIVSGFLERSGIAWLDLLPGLRAQADPTPRSALDSARDLHWRLDTHWTPRGNAVVAALVARQIVARSQARHPLAAALRYTRPNRTGGTREP
jgi:hypothetical protein